ncbi:MAG: DUF2142 domain-containing protein [Desulfobacterales bacterium]|jgi:hypothetical protein|nr:DUF2142 domain-containing protein [Desulfobacterales bacterium]
MVENFTKHIAQPARIFLILGLIAGVLLVFLIPPMQVADEWPHFYRAYLLAQGRMMGEGLGDKVPCEIHRLMWETDGFMGIPTRGPQKPGEVIGFLKNMAELRIVERDRVYAPFSTVLYAPVPYSGMTAGIAAADIWTNAPLLLLYAGRLGGLLLALAMTYWAIRITPFGKWAFLLIAMTPVLLFQRSGITADSFINALAMLYVAYILKSALDPNETTGNLQIMVMGLLTISICLCKQAYLALPVLMWAIPADKFASPGRRRMVRFGLPLLGWSAAVLWAFVVMRINYAPMIQGTDALGQLRYILSHPIEYGLIMMGDFQVNARKYLLELIGVLGWLDIPAFAWLVYAHAAVLLTVSCADHSGGEAPGWTVRILAAIALIASLKIIFTLMYLWWAPVGSLTLPGMQGRYFTPLLPLVPAVFCLPGRPGLFRNRWVKTAMVAWALILIGDTLFRTFDHYYF